MRHRATVVLALSAAVLLAACSDDATHAARAGADARQTGASANAGDTASAFNSTAPASGGASGDAPLATPVVHYPPDDSDDAPDSTATAAAPASTPG
ncbi:hypothetical protein [Burkholderia alba]|uniref:hypothetical protein n=1 Tax=Burkholderia alba TaxID=2683677 RepID=UPI002B057E27|nr:hypothetical protein [Burkholderia alba]